MLSVYRCLIVNFERFDCFGISYVETYDIRTWDIGQRRHIEPTEHHKIARIILQSHSLFYFTLAVEQYTCLSRANCQSNMIGMLFSAARLADNAWLRTTYV